MQLNTLFLPLLGGFLFYGTFHGTKYLVPSQSPQVLLFWSAANGLALLLIARMVVGHCDDLEQADIEKIHLLSGSIVRAALWSLFLGVATWIATELITREYDRAGFALVGAVIAFVVSLALYDINEARLAQQIPNGLVLWLVVLAAALILTQYGGIRLGTAIVRISLAVLIGIAIVVMVIEWNEQFTAYWRDVIIEPISGDAAKGLGSAFAACLMGIGAAVFANIVYSRAVAEHVYLNSKNASALERLFYLASTKKRMVMVTMKDRKVYIGPVKHLDMRRGAASQYLTMFPAISGYRDKDKQEVDLTSFYHEVLSEHVSNKSELTRFQRILPVDEVVSAGLFEQRDYDRFQARKVAPGDDNGMVDDGTG